VYFGIAVVMAGSFRIVYPYVPKPPMGLLSAWLTVIAAAGGIALALYLLSRDWDLYALRIRPMRENEKADFPLERDRVRQNRTHIGMDREG
jgi:hypothetical protein